MKEPRKAPESGYRVAVGSPGYEDSPNYSTISEALEEEHIVTVSRFEIDFQITEQCDRYYIVYLTREQMAAWIAELQALMET